MSSPAVCVPFDSADNRTSPSAFSSILVLSSSSSTLWSLLMLCFESLRQHRSSSHQLLAPFTGHCPPVVTYFEEVASHFLSQQSVVAQGVYTLNKLETVTPCPTLVVSCSLYLLPLSVSAWADFLLMALVDNCHKLPSWFHFPLSSPKFLALAWDKGMSTSKGSAKSLTPKLKGTAHNTVIESSYWSQSCITGRTAPVDAHTLFMTAAEEASRRYNRTRLLRRPYNLVVKNLCSPLKLLDRRFLSNTTLNTLKNEVALCRSALKN